MSNQIRSRTITWEDPEILAREAGKMSGVEFLEALRAGKLPRPPVGALLGHRVVEIGDGRVMFELETGEHLYNPMGTVHGGIVSTLLDTVMSCAVHTTLARGEAYSTAEIKVNFIRPVTRDVKLMRGFGQTIHVGKRLATAEGKLVDVGGKLYAHGVTTCMIFRNPA